MLNRQDFLRIVNETLRIVNGFDLEDPNFLYLND